MHIDMTELERKFNAHLSNSTSSPAVKVIACEYAVGQLRALICTIQTMQEHQMEQALHDLK